MQRTDEETEAIDELASKILPSLVGGRLYAYPIEAVNKAYEYAEVFMAVKKDRKRRNGGK